MCEETGWRLAEKAVPRPFPAPSFPPSTTSSYSAVSSINTQSFFRTQFSIPTFGAWQEGHYPELEEGKRASLLWRMGGVGQVPNPAGGLYSAIQIQWFGCIGWGLQRHLWKGLHACLATHFKTCWNPHPDTFPKRHADFPHTFKDLSINKHCYLCLRTIFKQTLYTVLHMWLQQSEKDWGNKYCYLLGKVLFLFTLWNLCFDC